MTAQYDPELCARLEAEAREDDARMEDAPWTIVELEHDRGQRFVVTARDGRNEISRDLADEDALGIARTRNNLVAVVDQLDAARAEVERWRQLAIRLDDKKHKAQAESERHGGFALENASERDILRAEVDRLRTELDSLRAVADPDNETPELSLRDRIMHVGEQAALIVSVNRIAAERGAERDALRAKIAALKPLTADEVRQVVQQVVADWLAVSCAQSTTLAEFQIASAVMGKGISIAVAAQLSGRPLAPAAALTCADLDEFFDAELSADRAAAFRTHLSSCERCQAVLHGRMQEAAVVDAAAESDQTPRCTNCDRPLATLVSYESTPEAASRLCWRVRNADVCIHPAVDWRSRALAAECR